MRPRQNSHLVLLENPQCQYLKVGLALWFLRKESGQFMEISWEVSLSIPDSSSKPYVPSLMVVSFFPCLFLS